MHNKIKNIIDSIFSDIVEWREHIHANPELSFKEYNTADFVATLLDKMNIPYKKGVAGTGIVALIKGRNPNSKCIGLRADLDALPIFEENDVSYKSTNDGVMHACGHDVHTSCLLGAAKVLSSLRGEFEGTIKLIFQPGEEVLPGGASLMINEGVLDNPKVDKMIALHVFPSMDVGNVGFKPGKYMAACDELYLKVQGVGGHAALPHQYVNPIMILAELLPKLDAYISSLSDGTSPYIFAFGKLMADGATNVIPEYALAEGTFRTMDEKWRSSTHEKMTAFVDEYLKSKNVSGGLEVRKGYPFLQNDEELTDKLFTAAQRYLGEKNVHEMDIRMTAEDFSYYSQKVPSCFFRLGVRNEELGIVHGVHHAKFDVDKNSLKIGAGLLAQLAIKALA